MKRTLKSTAPLPGFFFQNKMVQFNINTLRIGDFTLSLEPEQISWWRYLVFVTIVINITFSVPFLVDGLEGSYFNDSLFHVKNYSVAIWLLPASFFLFGLIQLIPRTYTNEGYDKLFRPLFFTTILQIGCLNLILTQTVPGILLLVGTLVASILLFIHFQKVLKDSSVKSWLQVPFSFYMACLSIITIAAIAGWLRSIGFTGGDIGETPFTILMIVFTTVLGCYMTFKKQDFIFPTVMAWSDITLWIEHCKTSAVISVIALSLGIFMIWCAMIVLISSKISKPKYDFPFSMEKQPGAA
jgi:hypothetical protein